jgi:N-acetylmuramoyl-L-alanine amidase
VAQVYSLLEGSRVPLTYVPTIIDVPSFNHSPRVFDTKRRPGTRVDTVLIHHTGVDAKGLWSDKGALNTALNPSSGVSWHYTVTTKGEVYRHVHEALKAWHAGRGRLPWETVPEYDVNHRSIGIELVNPGDGVTPFTEAQYLSLAWLVPDIVRRLGRDIFFRLEPCLVQGPQPKNEHVYLLGHRDVAPWRKTDPADNFDWGRIREALAEGVA